MSAASWVEKIRGAKCRNLFCGRQLRIFDRILTESCISPTEKIAQSFTFESRFFQNGRFSVLKCLHFWSKFFLTGQRFSDNFNLTTRARRHLKLYQSPVQAVEALPQDDYAPYLHFISVYGTHYVSSVVMGAKAMVRSEFEETAWNALKRQKFDVHAAAQASFWVVNLKLDVKVSQLPLLLR